MSNETTKHRSAETHLPPITTGQDSPVLLQQTVNDRVSSLDPGMKPRIVRIDNIDLRDPASAALPGIRVGDGDGSGYVMCRELDGQLVFVPDAGYTGSTWFACSIDDGLGGEFTQIATVHVHPVSDSPATVTFADGSHAGGVPAGAESAIVGALSIDGLAIGSADDVLVFESESELPSHRFTVSGDKLRLLEPLGFSIDETVRLRIVAYEDNFEIAVDELEILVWPTGHAPPPIPPARLTMVEAAANDRFEFSVDSDHWHPSGQDPNEEWPPDDQALKWSEEPPRSDTCDEPLGDFYTDSGSVDPFGL